MSEELPKGWVSLQIEDLTENPRQDIVDGPFGSNLKASEYVDKGVPVVRLQNIDRNRFLEKNIRFISSLKARELSRHSFWAGDIIITKLGNPVGKACIVPDSIRQGIIVADVVRARIDRRRAYKEFVAFAINSPRVSSHLNFEVKGSTRPRVNLGHIRKLEIQVPPINEQLRIVVKLEKLLGRVDTCQQRLTKIPVILKRFRQSVLAAACSGRLTADWRDANPSPTNHVEEELPPGWRTALVGQVIENLKYGTAQKCSYERRGVPVLRIPNIEQDGISHSDLKYAELPEKEFQHLRLQPGDVLLIRSNGSVSLVGKSALVREAERDFAYAGYLIRLRPDVAQVLPEFLNLVLGNYEIRIQIEVPARSTSGVNNINSEEVRALRFFLPPLPEQREIVRRAEAFFALADQIEARFAKAKTRVDQLIQSILAKAFRGELVPQNPNDESASVLLARIKAERANGETVAKGGGKKRLNLNRKGKGR